MATTTTLHRGPLDADQVDVLLDCLAVEVALARISYPADDYAGRIYFCEACRSVDACCAPLDDLVDDYPCPSCRQPQTPWTDPGVPEPCDEHRGRAL